MLPCSKSEDNSIIMLLPAPSLKTPHHHVTSCSKYEDTSIIMLLPAPSMKTPHHHVTSCSKYEDTSSSCYFLLQV
ncbi:hypothetical protein RRG08_037004 [Elysia crispata]|uniref:Uncharacterized protein n=1 Tax=Elysia crispata TaxID=231223 RepID=A0AAE1CLV9_9GAST|nr:hypothetical protein RRG08_037004 [Elysia crispata]